MKHDFIEANRHLYGVKLLCHTLHVSRSGFYAARHRQPSTRRQWQTMLTNQISAIHSASRDTYGAPRIHAELAAQGVACSHNTVAKLMSQAAIMPRCIRRFRVTTDSRKTKASPNLVSRNFHARGPDDCWLSDITYIPTREGWLYLAVILDMCSRKSAGRIRFSDFSEDPTNNFAGMFYFEFIELVGSVILLRRNERVARVALAARTVLDAWVDIKNLLKYPDY